MDKVGLFSLSVKRTDANNVLNIIIIVKFTNTRGLQGVDDIQITMIHII